MRGNYFSEKNKLCLRASYLLYCIWSCFETSMQDKNHKVKFGTEFFERVELFKHMGTTVTYQMKLRAC